MSLKFTQKITLDLTIPRIQNVRCVQDDRKSRIINIVVTNDGKPYKITNTMIVSYKVFKADSNYVWNKKDVVINDDGSVTIDLSEQAVAFVGIAKSSLKIQENEQKISTLPFNIIVEKAVVSDDAISSSIESDIIDDFESHLVDFNNPHRMPDATTTVKGITTLTDSVTSASITTAATPNSVKTVNDALVVEINRATNAEQIISDNLSAEANRATTVENNLETNKADKTSVYTKNEVDNKFSTLETNIDWKESVATFDDITTTYPNPVDGWTVNVKDTDYTYRYNGTSWVAISANAIPKATSDVDGLLTKEDYSKISSVENGAEVNQNAFSNVVIGSTTIVAGSKTDSLTLEAGSNVTLTPDVTNDKITISSSHPSISKSTDSTSTASPSAGGTFTTVDSVTRDTYGHVTKINTKTVTLPSTAVTVDDALSSTSTNPVQNKVINDALSAKLSTSGNAASATYATNARMTTTNPTSATTYYLPFISGITESTNYLLRGNNGIRYYTLEGTTSANGYSMLLLGNGTASGTAENKYGAIRAYGTGAYYTQLAFGTQTANRTITFPNASGTVALTSTAAPTSHASSSTTYGVGTTSNYGHVKLSNSSAVTDSTGLALPATEKNASIEGTLANQISALDTDLASLGGKYATCVTGANLYRYINFTGAFSAIVSAIGYDGNSYGAFLVQGYGVGSARIHFSKLQSGTSITCSIAAEDRESIIIKNASAEVTMSVFMLYGSLPTFTTT